MRSRRRMVIEVWRRVLGCTEPPGGRFAGRARRVSRELFYGPRRIGILALGRKPTGGSPTCWLGHNGIEYAVVYSSTGDQGPVLLTAELPS